MSDAATAYAVLSLEERKGNSFARSAVSENARPR
jgi:hypothetical protein